MRAEMAGEFRVVATLWCPWCGSIKAEYWALGDDLRLMTTRDSRLDLFTRPPDYTMRDLVAHPGMSPGPLWCDDIEHTWQLTPRDWGKVVDAVASGSRSLLKLHPRQRRPRSSHE